jgi:long-chain acyl-CoA synthetase
MENAIAQRFAQMAGAFPDEPALVFADMVYSYRMLQDLAGAFTVRMAAHGIGSAATVQLATRDLPVVLASLLATATLGARLAEGAVTRELSEAFPVTHRLCVSLPADAHPDERIVMVEETWSPAETAALPGPGAQTVDTEAPWLLVATSGTTGLPKVVGLSQAMVMGRSMAVADEFVHGKTRFVSLFPYGTRPFFARALGALLNGATIVDQGDWEFWIKAGVNRVSGSLRQVKSLVLPPDAKGRIAVVEVSGAKLTDADAREMLAYFDLVDDTYGATETSKSFSNHLTAGPGGDLRRVGAPRDSRVEIIDDAGKIVPPLQIGAVRVKNDYMATAYLFSPTGTAKPLIDGYFHPGDIARFTATGALDIVGRAQGDVLNFDGVKLSANILDQLMASVDGVLAAASFHSPKPGSRDVIAFAVFKPGQNVAQTSARARKACADALGPKLAPARIWPIDAIPRKADGTPDRAQCAALIMDAISRRDAQL